jgi:hypothetical protein
MGAEHREEDLYEEGNGPHGKMLQCPSWDTVRGRKPADLKAPAGFLNLGRDG